MPQKMKEIPVPGRDPDTILNFAYGALETLGWQVSRCFQNSLFANTPESWGSQPEEIQIESKIGRLEFTTKLIKGQFLDFSLDNEKRIEKFETAFTNLTASATDEQINQWKEKVRQLRTQTFNQAIERTDLPQNAEKDIPVASSGMHVTFALIAINVFVFILMATSGVSFLALKTADLVEWGGNMAVLTVEGDWWRLITSCFVHTGFVHLLFNMIGLFYLGKFVEPMLGKMRFIIAYLSTGVFSSVISMWWHRNELIVSAGASGAIFGLCGVFLGLLTTNLIAPNTRKNLLQGMLVFVVYNLISGATGKHVDNSAHVGGLISGFVIGWLYYFILRQKETSFQVKIITPLLVFSTFAFAVIIIEDVKSGYGVSGESNPVNKLLQTIEQQKDSSMVNATETNLPIHESNPDSEVMSFCIDRYIERNFSATANEDVQNLDVKLKAFIPVEELAIAIYSQPGNGSLKDFINQLNKIAETWNDAINSFSASNSKKLPPELKNMINEFVEYCQLYKAKTEILIKFYQATPADNIDEFNERLTNLNSQIEIEKSKIKFPS